ncbi:MAG: TetR/AcrR family transcriptional regulator [Campylobacterota bacterium]|nr:TetR/AcrR family transcriptional regulator [Campylobacterota bacterium]
MKKKKKSLTKEKIKRVSVQLFNENDTLSITTNHIASQAGISSGNLYYHYKNKEEILQELYSEMSQKFESFESFRVILSSQNPIASLWKMFDIYGELFWEYRFLMRDSAVLMALYPKLKEMFVQRQEKRIVQIEGLIQYFIQEDIFESMPYDEIKLRAKINWFISAYWQIFASSGAKVTKASINEAKEVLFMVNILPFLTDKGKEMADSI